MGSSRPSGRHATLRRPAARSRAGAADERARRRRAPVGVAPGHGPVGHGRGALVSPRPRRRAGSRHGAAPPGRRRRAPAAVAPHSGPNPAMTSRPTHDKPHDVTLGSSQFARGGDDPMVTARDVPFVPWPRYWNGSPQNDGGTEGARKLRALHAAAGRQFLRASEAYTSGNCPSGSLLVLRDTLSGVRVGLSGPAARGGGVATRLARHAGRPGTARRTGGAGSAPRTHGRTRPWRRLRPRRTAGGRAGQVPAPARRWWPRPPGTWGCGRSGRARR